MNYTQLDDYMKKCNDGTGSVGIFADFDNIYYSLKEYGADPESEEYSIFSLMEQIYSNDKIRTLRAYADYDQVKVSFKHL